MESKEIRQKFLDFFEKKGHVIVPSSSLLPDDPSVLITTAGMQQFKPYYAELDPETTVHPSLGKPIGKNAVSIQKCFRTSDIEEVGDESHLTFFEMMGNFSFGGYFKEKAIECAYKFITKEMNLEIDYVTIFDPSKVEVGDWRKGVEGDSESADIWEKLGIPKDKIKKEGVDNFWGPTGNEGPCGGTTEIYVKNSEGKSIEIWNVVFNEFYCDKNKQLKKLEHPGIDTGMGFERLLTVVNKKKTVFETDVMELIVNEVKELVDHLDEKMVRVLADHIKSSSFLICDGFRPGNKESGYILRRLIRRVLAYKIKCDVGDEIFSRVFEKVIETYRDVYPELEKNKKEILNVFEDEEQRFEKAIAGGIAEISRYEEVGKEIDAKVAFFLYETFGLPLEVTLELAPKELTNKINKEDFAKAFEAHQEISRAGVEKKFGGHGLLMDTGELKAGSEEEVKKVTRLHTATHLLHKALREVLGEEIGQRGSDITPERTRFDFVFGRKMTPEEIKKVEDIVNAKIQESIEIRCVELPREEAEKTGAAKFYKGKYPDVVKVYHTGDKVEEAWSKEFCGGPHVGNTKEIGKFKITKEESSSAGVRRIRAIVE